MPSRQQQADKGQDNPLEKTGDGVQDAQVKQGDDNEKAVTFQPEKGVLNGWRGKTHEDF